MGSRKVVTLGGIEIKLRRVIRGVEDKNFIKKVMELELLESWSTLENKMTKMVVKTVR